MTSSIHWSEWATNGKGVGISNFTQSSLMYWPMNTGITKSSQDVLQL